MKAIFTVILMALSTTALAYQPPILINQFGNMTTYSQGSKTITCHRFGNMTTCN